MLRTAQQKNITGEGSRRYPPIPEWVGVLAIYTLVAALFTWPLVIQMGSHVIGDANSAIGDSYQNMWYMWWYGRALELGQDPTQTHLMYGLLPSVQVLISSVINGLLMLPVHWLFGTVFAYNFAIFISFPLAGLFTYKLTGEFTRNRLARFVAGALFAFCAYHLVRAEGHLGLVTVEWLPFYAWRLFVLKRNPRLANALWAALGFAFAALSDLYYLGYFVLPFTLLFVLWFGWFERKQGFWGKPRLPLLALTLGLGALSLVPFYNVFLRLEGDVTDSVATRAREALDYSADLLAFFVPNPDDPFLGGLSRSVYNSFKTLFPVEQVVYPGYVLLLLALGALLLKGERGRNTFFWLVAAGSAFVLALGPHLHIAGNDTGLPLPYALYTRLPLLNTYRAPSRFGIVMALALAVLASLTLAWLYRKLSGWKWCKRYRARLLVSGVLVLVAFVEGAAFPWPTPMGQVSTPEIYRQIAAEPGDFLVMELPLGPLSLPLYYQTFYQKPLVGGYPARISNRMTLSFDQTPYLGMFNPAESSYVMDGSAAKIDNPDIFPLDVGFKQTLQAKNIRYVILRSYPTGRRFFSWMRPYLEKQLGAPTWKENDTPGADPVLAWRVEPGPGFPPVQAGQVRIRLGDGWNAGLGKGDDGKLQRLLQQDGKLLVEVANPATATVSLRFTPDIRPQTLEVRLNGQVVGRVTGTKEWASSPAQFANLPLKAGQNVMELHSVEGCLVAGDYLPGSPDRRCISLAIQDVRVDLAK